VYTISVTSYENLPYSLSIGTNVTLSVSTYIMAVSNVSVGGYWLVCTIILSGDSSSSLSIVANGTLSVSTNNLTVSNVSVGGYWLVYTIILSGDSALSIGTNGTLSVSTNSMAVSNVSVSGDWNVYTISVTSYENIPSSLSIGTNGTLSVSTNSMAVSNVSVEGYWNVYTIILSGDSSALSIGTNGTLSVSTNSMAVSNVSVGGWNVYTISTYSLSIGANGTLSVSNNNNVVNNASALSGNAMLLGISGAVTDDGEVHIFDNVLNGLSVQSMSLLRLDGLSGNGSISLLRNRMSNGLVIDYLGNTSADVPISTCSNYVGRLECRSTSTDLPDSPTNTNTATYSCAAGGSYLSMDDCDNPTKDNNNAPPDGTRIAIIAGSAAGGAILILAAVVGAIVFVKLRHKNNSRACLQPYGHITQKHSTHIESHLSSSTFIHVLVTPNTPLAFQEESFEVSAERCGSPIFKCGEALMTPESIREWCPMVAYSGCDLRVLQEAQAPTGSVE
jgi:hypothetical protein